MKVIEFPGDAATWLRPALVTGQDAAKYRPSTTSSMRVYKLVPVRHDPRAEHRCSVCGHRFIGIDLFELHRVGDEHTLARRCLRTREMHTLRWNRRDGGTWYATKQSKIDARAVARMARAPA